jgi:hypothetical protein
MDAFIAFIMRIIIFYPGLIGIILLLLILF